MMVNVFASPCKTVLLLTHHLSALGLSLTPQRVNIEGKMCMSVCFVFSIFSNWFSLAILFLMTTDRYHHTRRDLCSWSFLLPPWLEGTNSIMCIQTTLLVLQECCIFPIQPRLRQRPNVCNLLHFFVPKARSSLAARSACY